MNSLVRVFSNFKEFYSEINGATLTGAIDVIVVEQADGEFLCSPFHVRFGKLGVLRSREKVVDIEINGDPVDIHMKLGESGEAFFVEECPEDDEEIPENLATSPIPSSDFDKKFEENNDKTFENASEDVVLPLPIPRRNSIDLAKEHIGDEIEKKKFENQISDFSHRRHTDRLERRDLSATKKEFTTQKIRQEWAEHEDQLFLSTENLHKTQDPTTSNVSLKQEKNEQGTVAVEQPTFNLPHEPTIVLTESKTKEEINISNASCKEESKSKKKRRKKSLLKKKNAQRKSSSSSSLGSVQLETNENEGDAISLSNATASSNDESPSKVDGNSLKIEGKPEEIFISDTKISDAIIEKDATLNRIRDLDIHFFSDTEVASGSVVRTSRPSTPIQSDSELEISQREKSTSTDVMTNSASWKWDAEGMDPEMISLYFPPIRKDQTKSMHDDDRESGNGTSLPHSPSSMEGPKSLDSDFDDGKSSDKYLDFVSLSLCGGLEKGSPTDDEFNRHVIKHSDDAIEQLMSNIPKLTEKEIEEGEMDKAEMSQPQAEPEPKRSYWRWYWGRSGGDKQRERKSSDLKDVDQSAVGTQTSPSTSPDETPDESQKDITDTLPGGGSVENTEYEQAKNISNTSILKGEKYRKTLRLSSEQIKSLNLKVGMNEVEFSVTTAYQGTTRCKCYLFRWKHSDKVVISDIDGTITKSDVLGHILPMVGKDWAQIGVAPLFSKIEQNGYKLLYLSARAIGQSRATREYLRSIRQGDVKLPDGPLLLNPTSLISAFHREVIEKKPEQFKIACLSDIQALFPENPFYAGYGNRINDVWAYRAVGIPIMRIFTINTKGELKHELTQTFQSSYPGQTQVVNEIFPPRRRDDEDHYLSDTTSSDEEMNYDNNADEIEDELQFRVTDEEELILS